MIRHRISKARESGKRHIRQRPYIIPVFGLALGFIIVLAAVLGGSGKTMHPSDAHVVFLFDKGDRVVLDTKAQTVGELIGKLPLNLIPEDVVEPSLDVPIPEDNFRINIYRARPVTVVDKGSKTVALTAQKSPRVVAQAAGLSLQPEDQATFEQGKLLENVIGEKVVVSRATPVDLNLYGAQLTAYTQAKTVGDFLTDKKIELLQGESVQPEEKTPITPNLPIFVLKKDAKIVTEEAPIDPPEQTVNDPTLSFGTTVVRQDGSPGKKIITYILQTDSSGKELSRQVLHEVQLQDPVPQITARGSTIAVPGDKTGLLSSAGIAAGDHAYANYIISRESNWRPAAKNPSGAYGLCQALPGSKMASAGADWETNPATQLRWCNSYAKERYGGWSGAYSFWQRNHYW